LFIAGIFFVIVQSCALLYEVDWKLSAATGVASGNILVMILVNVVSGIVFLILAPLFVWVRRVTESCIVQARQKDKLYVNETNEIAMS
jgi:hypothetical protein